MSNKTFSELELAYASDGYTGWDDEDIQRHAGTVFLVEYNIAQAESLRSRRKAEFAQQVADALIEREETQGQFNALVNEVLAEIGEVDNEPTQTAEAD